MAKIVTDDTLAARMDQRGTIVLLTRLAKQVHRRSSEDLLGVSLRQLVVLSFLRDKPGVPQAELCEALWFDPNNCVLLLNELEAAGLVERRRDQQDRRRHLVELTPAGLRAIEKAERAQESLEDEVLGPLSEAERTTLRKLLRKALETPRVEHPAA